MAKGDSSGAEVDEGKTKEDFNSMAERLRLRSGKKPSYVEEDAGEDDVDWESDEVGKMDDKQTQAKKKKQRAESCSVCNSGERLIFCSTCLAAYHIGCLNPPLKVAPRGKWSCPQCVDPLADIDKFLDCQMRSPTISGANVEDEAAAGTSSESPKRQYLVKWKSRSFLHCTWVLEAELEKVAKNYSGLKIKLNNFRRQMESSKSWNMLEDDLAPIRPEWTTVEKILDFRQTGGVKEYLVKWKELGYEDLSWEVEEDIVSFQDQIEKFNTMKSRASKSSSKKRKGSTIESREGKKKPKDFKAYEETPKFLSGGVLHRYQLEGLNFLRFAWRQGKHVILADEMGLGKTIQSISFLASLLEEGVLVPHLVVAPLSTLRNWEREFATWAPQMNTVMYVGSAQARAVIREYEFYFPKEKVAQKKKRLQKKQVTAKQNKQDRIKFNVLLTSYEMINLDTTILKSLKWECLIVDEGHRLKNKDSKLFQTLRQYSTRHRVLLTGTPLQNNLDELFMLMHFLDAGKFASLEEFQEEFRDINQEEQVGRLHKMLAPHLLRRVKNDVMKDLPPKKELILRVELSSLQKEYYKAILTRNYQLLSRRGGPQISLNNVAMELRKLCGHPYLLEGVEPTVRKASEAYRQLLEASGKLLLMDKMMVKLKDRGHRVLIYSQFKIMLDILEDWLSYKKWSYERIDGSVSGTERQVRIDRFNAPNSTRFCFLLSTRAGGLGINLATADTVIIYDSDWNPHADLQAMARAHRLGQTNKVMIYRLVTRGSIEERMMQMTKKKMVLEHLVVGRMKTQQVLNQEELDDILRYGAKELFAEENDETKKSQQIHYDEAAIDRLLDRSQVENEDAGADEEDNDFLKAFKVANFEYVDEEEAAAARAKLAAEAEADKDGDKISSADRAKYWEDLLKQRFEEQKYESFVELGKGKRARKQVVPLAEDDLAGMANISSDDDDDEREPEPVVAEVSNTAKEANEPVGKKSQVSRKKPRVEHTEPAGPPPLLAGEGKSLRILGFNRRQRAMFVQILMRFGIGDFSWSEFIPRLKPKTSEEIKDYGTLFLTHIAEDISDSPTFSDGVPKEGLRIQDVLVRLAILHLMQDKVNNFTEEPAAPLFSDEVHKRLPALMNTKVWKEPHDRKLLQAILKHGYGRWQEIMDDTELNFQSVISKELQLPSTSGGGSGQDDANIPTYQPGQGETSLPSENVQGGLPVSDSFQGAVHGEPVGVPSAGNVVQSTQEDLTVVVMSSKDTQQQSSHKRMVEFIKRRAMLLEKALNAEYHQETTSEQRGDEDVDDDNLTMGMQGPEIDTQVQHGRSQSPVPTPLAPEEIVACAFDSESRRLEVARIYNEMCKLVNESEADAAETYSGNKAAGVRLRRSSRQMDGLCVEMRKSLVAMHSPESTHERNHGGNNNFGMNGGAGAAVMGEDVDAQSDDRDEDAEPELDSDGDMPATPFGQRKSGVHGSSERHKTQETTAVYTTDVNSNCKTDNLTSGKNNVIFGRQFSNPQNNSTSWASVVVLDD